MSALSQSPTSFSAGLMGKVHEQACGRVGALPPLTQVRRMDDLSSLEAPAYLKRDSRNLLASLESICRQTATRATRSHSERDMTQRSRE